MTMLEYVKMAMRVSTGAYDDQIEELISASCMDLGIAGVLDGAESPESDTVDPLIRLAIATYCRMNFGSPADYDRLKSAYDEQKAQLQMSTGHTDWGKANG